MSSHTAVKTGVELKGGMYTFMSLKLATTSLDLIDETLADKVQQAPGFFKDTPIVLDLTLLNSEQLESMDPDKLLKSIRRHQLIPIVASVQDNSSQFASALTLPLIDGGVRSSSVSTADKPAASDSAASGNTATSTAKPVTDAEQLDPVQEIQYVVKTPMLVKKPIRSGQQVYARDTDLIIMGQVGPGAEVIADNNIHVYGALRGRAICGVSGNNSARIFCQSLEAELVSVAGNYRMLEMIPENLRGKPAQISLDNDRLSIEPL